jgi:hypothetical protein
MKFAIAALLTSGVLATEATKKADKKADDMGMSKE